MGFFARGGEQDDEQSEALARIEKGGIPERAQERLKMLGRGDVLFTSGLSVKEFALLDRMGPRPLAQVMGASVVRTGWQYLPALDPAPVTLPRTQGWGAGTVAWVRVRAAIGSTPGHRTLTEAGVELQVAHHRRVRARHADRRLEPGPAPGARPPDRGGAPGRRGRRGRGPPAPGRPRPRARDDRVLGHGTAIRVLGSDGSSWPTLTDVSVQDYWRLRSRGHEPAGLLATTAVVFASPPTATRMRRARQVTQNQELEELNRGFQAARDTVRAKLLGQVSDAHAAGVVGVEFAHSVERDKLPLASSLTGAGQRGWRRGRLGMPYRVSGHSDVERRGWVITMHAAGTAIRPGAQPSAPPVKTTMRMRSTEMSDYDPKSVEGIPESGVERLAQNRQGLYTSDLSVNEFLLVTEAGFDPVGLVVGSSIFHIGIQVAGRRYE